MFKNDRALARRRAAIQKLLTPLVAPPPEGERRHRLQRGRDQKHGPQQLRIRRSPIDKYKVVFGAEGGTAGQTHHDAWRFPTYVKDYRASYIETWVSPDGKPLWQLKCIYIGVYRYYPLTREEAELLCVHADPIEWDGSDSEGDYKSGPHLHVGKAPHPTPKAHFALCDGMLPTVLASAEDLISALSRALTMIRVEWLERCRTELES